LCGVFVLFQSDKWSHRLTVIFCFVLFAHFFF
jgi:hypothetical protein